MDDLYYFDEYNGAGAGAGAGMGMAEAEAAAAVAAAADAKLTAGQASTSEPHDNHINRHRVREFAAPQPAQKVTLAFGNLTQPVLVKKMQSDDVEIVRNALGAVVRLFPVSINVVHSIKAGGIAQLTVLTKHADDLVRQRATMALQLLMNNASGRRAASKVDVVKGLAHVLDDADDTVRLNFYTALQNLTSAVQGPEALVAAGYVRALVKKSTADSSAAVQALALVIVARCVNVIGGAGLRDALANGATAACIKCIQHADTSVRHRACMAMAAMCFAPEGKAQAIKGGAVPLLCHLLDDASGDVRAGAAAALMGIVTDDAGKAAIVEVGVAPLVVALRDEVDLVVLNTLKAVATVAASPAARKLLVEAHVIEDLETLSREGTAPVRLSAETAIDAVQWTP